MKRYLFLIVSVLIFSSCIKGYHHEKRMINNSRNSIEIIANCCGNEENYLIAVGEEKIVFSCFYESIKKPKIDELSWDFTLVTNDQEFKIDNPNQWLDQSTDRKLKFVYFVED